MDLNMLLKQSRFNSHRVRNYQVDLKQKYRCTKAQDRLIKKTFDLLGHV